MSGDQISAGIALRRRDILEDAVEILHDVSGSLWIVGLFTIESDHSLSDHPEFTCSLNQVLIRSWRDAFRPGQLLPLRQDPLPL